MISFKKAAAGAAVAGLALAALMGGAVSASAQNYGDGQDGAQSDTMRVSRSHQVRGRVNRSGVVSRRDEYRPLTVARRRFVPAPVVVAAPRYNPYAGPSAIITGPIAIGGEIASLPFRILGGIFPPVGPTAIVGVPVRVAGQLAQVPFDIAQAPFGGPGPSFAY